jgi:hypothetical protein
MQKTYKQWLDKAREEANDSLKHPSLSTDPRSPDLEEIPKKELPQEESSPIEGPSTMLGEF